VPRAVSDRQRVRRLTRRFGVLAACVAGLQGCATTAIRRPPSHADTINAVIRLERINEDYWDFLQLSRPELAAEAAAVVTKLPDPTQDQAKQDAQFARAALVGLDEVLVDALPQDSYVNWLLLRWEMEALSGWTAFHWTRLSDLAPGQSVFDRAIRTLKAQHIAGVGDGQRFVRLVSSVGDLARNVRLEYLERARRDIRLPRQALNRAIAHVRELIGPPGASPFGRPPDVTVEGDSAWLLLLTRDISTAITERVNPALDSLLTFLESQRDSSPAAIGMNRLPGGAVHYAALLRNRTTLEITPEDAHATGLREVARLASLAAAARNEARLPVSRDSLRGILGTDTQFVIGDAGSIPEVAAKIFEQAVTDLDSLFPPTPRIPLAIGIQAEMESGSSLVEYEGPSLLRQSARYLINPVKLGTRSSLVLPGLILRDLMPGIHHQRATQFENLGLPTHRRLSSHEGFVKGWGIYALHVADSLSRTLTPVQRFGARLQELAAACGLVVDTGINALGWSSEDALAFLRSYLLLDDADLIEEFILAAIESPGELSAGTLGAREFRGLRRWAMRELGDRFSLSEFHREVLRVGSVPLPVLGSHLERWIWEQNNPASPTARR
jgi:uncharacterized protein (DUF885 family)